MIGWEVQMQILMQFVCIVGFDWLLLYVKFSIYQLLLKGSTWMIRHLENKDNPYFTFLFHFQSYNKFTLYLHYEMCYIDIENYGYNEQICLVPLNSL